MRTIEERIKELPPELQAEVVDFIQFLLHRKKKRRKAMRQNWAGGLSRYRDQYKSVELQKKSLEWRED